LIVGLEQGIREPEEVCEVPLDTVTVVRINDLPRIQNLEYTNKHVMEDIIVFEKCHQKSG
jgi:hypothetical protein